MYTNTLQTVVPQQDTNAAGTRHYYLGCCFQCPQALHCIKVLTLFMGVPQSSPGMSVTSTLLLPGVLEAWVARNSARLNATSRDRSHSHCNT